MTTLRPLFASLWAVSCTPAAEQQVPRLHPATQEGTAVVRAVLRQVGLAQGPSGRPVAALLARLHFAPGLGPGQPPPRPIGYFATSMAVLYALNSPPGAFLTRQDSVTLGQQAAAMQEGCSDTTLFAPGYHMQRTAQ